MSLFFSPPPELQGHAKDEGMQSSVWRQTCYMIDGKVVERLQRDQY